MALSEKAQVLLVNAANGNGGGEGRISISRKLYIKSKLWIALCIAGNTLLDGIMEAVEDPPMTYRTYLEYIDAAGELVALGFAREVEKDDDFSQYYITLQGLRAADKIALETSVNEVLEDEKVTDFLDNLPSS